MKFKKLKLTLAGLIISVCSLNSNAGIIISGDVTNGTGVFTITEDIVFNLGGTATNPNADPYALMFHDWTQSFGAFVDDPFLGGGGRYQLVGDKLNLSRTPTPFDPTLDNFVSGSGASRVFSNELTSAPQFDGNFYNRGSVLWFSDTNQRVRNLGFDNGIDDQVNENFVIGAGSWLMPQLNKWDLYGEFSGEATLYLALGYNAQENGAIPVATTSITSVPEPSTLAIFALGIMGLASRRFKKQS
ncbi:PEP-CTERM sorting domain-containing protein [uncultured Paraglaciecola sp.]|uniref:PEP-CTERM sorting domain-containing protein n=1 Tax=uncultured Paraglaciecola sp. TaxID=1765024 RepID=UPI0026051C5B|nr:PEP-CTERM sorting domain-containing protein [uncultured Paraglaciecola sp.]